MSRRKMIALLALFLTASVLFFSWFIWELIWGSLFLTKVVDVRVRSPDGRYVATVYTLSILTSDVVTHVNVSPYTPEFHYREDEIVFSEDYAGVKPEWRSPRHLHLYVAGKKPLRPARQWRDVHITFSRMPADNNRAPSSPNRDYPRK